MKPDNQNKLIIVRGAGEMASGVIHQLYISGYKVIALEQAQPVCVRRMVCFANAFYESEAQIEGVRAVLANNIDEALKLLNEKIIPLLIDPEGKTIEQTSPIAVIDGRMKKKEVHQTFASSTIYIGLGPGFTAGQNCHAVIETNRGENLGKVIYKGSAQEYTGVPAEVNSYSTQRVLRSPVEGMFISLVKIGDIVKTNDLIGKVDNIEIRTQINGVVRGLIHDTLSVRLNHKIGDVDPRGKKELCFKISDKANAIGQGVEEALSRLCN